MGLINAFIDCLDKKWGEQAMQRTLDEQDRRIAEKDRAIEALWKKKVELQDPGKQGQSRRRLGKSHRRAHRWHRTHQSSHPLTVAR